MCCSSTIHRTLYIQHDGGARAGHDYDAVTTAWKAAEGKHVAIIATTTKGGGTVHMPTTTHPVTGMLWQPWHTKIPSWELYTAIVDEQLAAARSPAAVEAWAAHRAAKLDAGAIACLPNTMR